MRRTKEEIIANKIYDILKKNDEKVELLRILSSTDQFWSNKKEDVAFLLESYYLDELEEFLKIISKKIKSKKMNSILGNEYLSTNLKNDNNLDLTKTYKLQINESRNGNLDLIDIVTGDVVLEFQNNRIEEEDLE